MVNMFFLGGGRRPIRPRLALSPMNLAGHVQVDTEQSNNQEQPKKCMRKHILEKVTMESKRILTSIVVLLDNPQSLKSPLAWDCRTCSIYRIPLSRL